MAARITINRPFVVCPACEKEIDAETVVSFDGDQGITGAAKTVNLNGKVVGIKLQHDCTPKPTRGRGRPPGAKNKPKGEAPIIASGNSSASDSSAVSSGISTAEARRDRLREHEATVQTSAGFRYTGSEAGCYS